MGLTDGHMSWRQLQIVLRPHLHTSSPLRISKSAALAVVGHNMRPFVGIRPRDDSDHGLSVAEVEDFMRNAGLDVNEVASLLDAIP